MNTNGSNLSTNTRINEFTNKRIHESGNRKSCFVDVILPLPLSQTYTYRVPVEFQDDVAIGKRVEVQFGKKKIYSAIIKEIKYVSPELYEAKNLISVLDEAPIVYEQHIQLWQWIAEYYMCTLGEVMNVALPAGLKLSSETSIMLHPEFDLENTELSEKEYLIIEALRYQGELSLKKVSEILDVKTIYPIIRSLINKSVVFTTEELIKKYKPKRAFFIELSEEYLIKEKLETAFQELERAPKQLELLMSYININNSLESSNGNVINREIKKSVLLNESNISAAALKGLVNKGIFNLIEKDVDRLVNEDSDELSELVLSGSQTECLNEIHNMFEKQNVVLLHGETGSGKTEIYIKLIKETLAKGKRALYLLPEIALTTQIINRLRKHFGDKVGVYHSKFNDNERVELWNKVLKGEIEIMLGARSALFLPIERLGLIIVDEEHENTFKQFDPAPRYNARDTAIYYSQVTDTKVLLGTATPSIENFYNAQIGKFCYVRLSERYGSVKLPEIVTVDLIEEIRKRKIRSHYSSVLINHITEALNNKEQVILFQNRRGYVPFLECSSCGFVPHCNNCDVSLTYHKFARQLRCHYCGAAQNASSDCLACAQQTYELKGFGTEKIEDELKVFFPDATIKRLDIDTTRSKYSYEKILNDFDEREIDILVGTQMVTKGLDFAHVSLVGILSADSLLNFPDFRAFEHAYQLMAQVSGRAGRKSKRGKVVIQTYKPDHEIVKFVESYNFTGLYNSLIKEREKFDYPPFTKLIKLSLKHKDQSTLNKVSKDLVDSLTGQFSGKILGPEFPPIKRVRNLYQKNILIKLPRNEHINRSKAIIRDKINFCSKQELGKSVRFIVDVDPR
ncbi:MAG: primosomal protein N' [Bacteroidetes bacterium]|nr:MAG: primosomal protein N' [Bacteroidota bacterium]